MNKLEDCMNHLAINFITKDLIKSFLNDNSINVNQLSIKQINGIKESKDNILTKGLNERNLAIYVNFLTTCMFIKNLDEDYQVEEAVIIMEAILKNKQEEENY